MTWRGESQGVEVLPLTPLAMCWEHRVEPQGQP